MSRNELCACGSGKRFKHCHGRQPASSVAPPPSVRFDALAAHRSGSLGRAESLYRRALEENPQDIDSLHMLGVVQYERMRYRDALEVLCDAAARTGWSASIIRHNIGLVLGKLMSREANARQEELLQAFVARERARKRRRSDATPMVSVVLRAMNDARFVAHAIESVASQTWPRIELVVIDDGSSDGTATVVRDCLAGVALPARFITREHRGAAATLNEGAALTQGPYLAFLDACDHYAHERIERMVDEVARGGESWGFSLVAEALDHLAPDQARGRDAFERVPRQRNVMGVAPNSFTLAETDMAMASGNLFVERGLFLAAGEFRDYRERHGWDFCQRAAAIAEPVVVDAPLYFRRASPDGRNEVAKDADADDAQWITREFLARTLTGDAAGQNELGPQFPANREVLLRSVFRAGRGELVPVATMQTLAARWRLAADAPAGNRADAPAIRRRRTALVVLGMHRSGTSAMSRVLNLCGAFLPDKVTPAKLGVNPKGFWEPESVVDLDMRLLHQLGGDWNRVEFALPTEGDLITEFASDAGVLLAAEYGDRELILIKDPRIGVLAPLWHRALLAADYRPVYVVPVRNPLEVAQSLHARGDMSVAEGLALWAAYMRRIEAFADTCDDVVHVRFADLLQDWRGVVDCIAKRLDVPLVIDARQDEVDAFLDNGLRNQQASDEALDAQLATTPDAEIGPLYRAALDRTARDAGNPRVGAAAAIAAPLSIASSRDAQQAATATFVLCIENNAIRNQALLLCESIRHFGGRYRDADIIAYAPRPGLGIDTDTRRMLADMKVAYVDEPLNSFCAEYGSANRIVAGAHAERHADTDFIVVLDSDTLWLEEPELPLDADAAARPVDEKGSATRGPGDRFESYWQSLADICGIPLDRLPWLNCTISNERIRASYNGGLIVARRRLGILARCADLFNASVGAGLRPYRDTQIDVIASTGSVGLAASEYWGSNQAALALSIWAATDRVRHYPDSYNVPLHLLTSNGDIDGRWLIEPPRHVHYHGMFDLRQHEIALELLERLGVAADKRAWLRARIPLRKYRARASAGAIAAA